MLMPTEPFRDRLSVYGPSVRSLLRLAKELGSSLASTARRLAEVNVWKCHVGFWRLSPDRQTKLEFGVGAGLSWTIPRGYTAGLTSIVSRAGAARQLVGGWSDIGFISPRGEPLGEVFAEAVPVSGGKAVISVAVFEKHPEQLCAMLSRVENNTVSDLRVQPRFRFETGSS
jgi:hypothetical protein